MASTPLTTKKDVREFLKSLLQGHVDAGLLEEEELKGLVKKGVDAIALPSTRASAELHVLRDLEAVWVGDDGENMGGRDAALTAAMKEVRERITSLEAAPLPPTTTCAASGTAPTSAAAPTVSLSLGALKARMARKREELQHASPPASAAATADGSVVDARSPGTLTASVSQTTTPHVSANAAPTPPPFMAELPAARQEVANGSSVSAIAPAPSHTAVVEEAPASTATATKKRERAEPILLSAAAVDLLESEDLYATIPMAPQHNRGGRQHPPRMGSRHGYATSSAYPAHAPPPYRE